MHHMMCLSISTILQGPEGDKIIEMALSNPHNYVLKPSREGGGKHMAVLHCTHLRLLV